MFKSVIFALAASASLTQGHNWLENPESYNGNKAAQAKPCPPKAAGYEGITVKIGQTIPTKWTTNHGGNHIVKVAATMAELEAADPVTTIANPGGTYDLKLDTAGTYVVQYGWNGYRNCFDVTVEADPPQTPCGAVTDCQVASGRHSSCVDGTCKCSTGYSMNQAGVCVNPSGKYTVTCATYCEDALNWCTGKDALYSSTEQCLGKCAQFPLGKPTDTTGNSLHCRFYHLHVEDGLPGDHCPHASYGGLDKDHCAGEGNEYIVAAILSVSSDMSVDPALVRSNVINALAKVDLINDMQIMDCAAGNGEYTCVIQFSGEKAEANAAALVAKKATLSSEMVNANAAFKSLTVESSAQGEPVIATVGAGSGAISQAAPALASVLVLALAALY